jgi:hypothetical protein
MKKSVTMNEVARPDRNGMPGRGRRGGLIPGYAPTGHTASIAALLFSDVL